MEPLTKAQLEEYNRVTKCHICFKPFREGNRKVRDHCHYSGKYRGAAHSLCNLQYNIPSYIPVVFHNLAGYNAHMFIKDLAKHGSNMAVIAKDTEDYISFSVNIEVEKYTDKNGEERSKEISLRFIDSIKFMSSSLDSLVNNLARGGGEFFGFENYSGHQSELLIRKRIYPYEYMDSWDRFEETTLPPASSFYSKLNMSRVSDQDYKHVCKVWRDFGIRNLGEYHKKKCKGIKKCVVKKTISFEDYKTCLFGGEASYRSQLMFRSSKHEVKMLEVNKLAVSRDDDKRIMVDGIASLARGQ